MHHAIYFAAFFQNEPRILEITVIFGLIIVVLDD